MENGKLKVWELGVLEFRANASKRRIIIPL
jgi:hypothetical protein